MKGPHKHMKLNQLNNHRGFTLIEAIAVLVIAGILSALAIASFTGKNSDLFSVEAALKNHIRYAQSKSMFSDTGIWGICLDANGETYWLAREQSGVVAWTSITKPFGAEASDMLDAQGRMDTSMMNVVIDSVSAGSSLMLLFDNMGIPFYSTGAGSVTINGPLMDNGSLTRATSDIRIVLMDSAQYSGNTRTITVTHETGFVP